jgi:hypothetical protein
VFASQNVGQLLQLAMESRKSAGINEVSRLFQNALLHAGNPDQKVSVLTAFADYLLEKQAYGQALSLYKRIINEGSENDSVYACYCSMQAYLMQNQKEKARQMGLSFMNMYPNNKLQEFAEYMAELSPGSVHADIARIMDKLSHSTALDSSGLRVKHNIRAPGRLRYRTNEIEIVPAPPVLEKTSGIKHIADTSKQKRSAAPKAISPSNNEVTGLQHQLPSFETADQKDISGKSTPALDDSTTTEKGRELSFRVKLWNSGLDGHIESRGMNFDLGNDADFNSQYGPGVEGSWQFSQNSKLHLGYVEFDHSSRLNRTVVFDNLSYTNAASVKVQHQLLDTCLSYLTGERESLWWELLGGIYVSKNLTRFEQNMASGLRAGEISQRLVYPYLGARSSCKLSDNTGFEGSIKYLLLNKARSVGRLSDFDFSINFGRGYYDNSDGTTWFGTVGYKYLLLNGDGDAAVLETRYSGPVCSINSRF